MLSAFGSICLANISPGLPFVRTALRWRCCCGTEAVRQLLCEGRRRQDCQSRYVNIMSCFAAITKSELPSVLAAFPELLCLGLLRVQAPHLLVFRRDLPCSLRWRENT